MNIKTQEVKRDLKNLEDFEFSNLNENREIFRNKNKNVVGNSKIESSTDIFVDEFVWLRIKAHSYKCNFKNKTQINKKVIKLNQKI